MLNSPVLLSKKGMSIWQSCQTLKLFCPSVTETTHLGMSTSNHDSQLSSSTLKQSHAVCRTNALHHQDYPRSTSRVCFLLLSNSRSGASCFTLNRRTPFTIKIIQGPQVGSAFYCFLILAQAPHVSHWMDHLRAMNVYKNHALLAS